MIFKQFYLESLGHASYFVGSEDTGEALVLVGGSRPCFSQAARYQRIPNAG